MKLRKYSKLAAELFYAAQCISGTYTAPEALAAAADG